MKKILFMPLLIATFFGGMYLGSKKSSPLVIGEPYSTKTERCQEGSVLLDFRDYMDENYPKHATGIVKFSEGADCNFIIMFSHELLTGNPLPLRQFETWPMAVMEAKLGKNDVYSFKIIIGEMSN